MLGAALLETKWLLVARPSKDHFVYHNHDEAHAHGLTKITQSMLVSILICN